MPKSKNTLLPLLAVFILSLSFWYSDAWLRLSSGIALFLFGMQCLEEGLKQLAGGKMEQWLEHSTATRWKGFLFGAGGTMVLQSTTLMSMLTIAFISTGMIQLAGGISIILGINLGATGGMWLLALAGQNISLSPLAMPLLVFGVLARFGGDKGPAIGRLILGIALVFLGIEQMKSGFADFGSDWALGDQLSPGLGGQLMLALAGMALTAMLMSSHATLMLILAALAAGQLELWQAMSVAIGGSVGSSINVGVMGWLGGNRSGQRLALVHILFNLVSGLLTFVLLTPLVWFVQQSMGLVGAGNNNLLQLALFQTLFNLTGVLVLWPLQGRLVLWMQALLPDRNEPEVLISAASTPSVLRIREPLTCARYLTDAALASTDTAMRAVAQELQHLGRLSLEVICHALYQPVEQLSSVRVDEARLNALPRETTGLDAEALYQLYIKGVYSDLLGFMSKFNLEMDDEQQRSWLTAQVAALQLVDAVKDAKHLQKNLGHYLRDDRSLVHNHYLDLRRHLLWVLRQIREVGALDVPEDIWRSRLEWLDGQAAKFDSDFRNRIFAEVRKQKLDNLQASSLMNDLGYVSRITQSLRNVLQLGVMDGGDLLREVRQMGNSGDGEPLIKL